MHVYILLFSGMAGMTCNCFQHEKLEKLYQNDILFLFQAQKQKVAEPKMLKVSHLYTYAIPPCNGLPFGKIHMCISCAFAF